jgi:hypothetical protein
MDSPSIDSLSASRDTSPRPIISTTKDAIASSSTSSSLNNKSKSLPFTITPNPHPPIPTPTPTTTNETRRVKIIIMLKLQLLVLFLGAFTLFVKLGRTTVVSIPVARLTHPAMEAMGTFFPVPKDKGKAKETAKARGGRVKGERKRAVVQQEERVEKSVVGDGKAEVEFQVNNGEMITEHRVEGEKMYTQLELVNVTEEKRGLMNWVMQMEHSGQTFFDG